MPDSLVAGAPVLREEEQPEQLFRNMANSAPVLLWMAGTDGLCSFFNETWLSFTGRSLDQERGVGWAEGVHPEDFETCMDTYMQSFRVRAAFEMIYRLRRHDGTYRWILDRGVPRYLPDGQFAGYIGSCADITDARTQRERLRQVVECSPSATLLVSAEGCIVLVNAQAEHIFGYAREELLGQPVEVLASDVAAPGQGGFGTEFLLQAKAHPLGSGMEISLRRKDGGEFPAEVAVSAIDTGEGPMVLAAIMDISERRERMARIEAALREKDLMLGEIHHRVKNNLQIIHSLLEMQSRRIEDPVVREALEGSRNRVRSMSLIHQTLYQSQDFEQVDFRSFLELLLPMLMESSGAESGQIRLDIEAAQVTIPIDIAIPCGLIVNELVTNALKHAFPRGSGGTIRVSLGPDADGRTVLCVADDGVPLADDVSGYEKKSLGLKLVNLLADQIGGSLQISRSAPKQFIVRFQRGKV
ncbi:MAG: PAS domain S-box protein [Rhodocyclaceae bacterium]|nr:PAS domain S-box protein [Rhodocyclaceae bacterium]MBX3668332.1 PAS domain S-box protein [Rhodocyclaceae bacterium]